MLESQKDKTITDWLFPLKDEAQRRSLREFHDAFEKFEPAVDIQRFYASQWPKDKQDWLKQEYPIRYWNALPRFVKAWLKREVAAQVATGDLNSIEPWLLRLYATNEMLLGEDGREK